MSSQVELKKIVYAVSQGQDKITCTLPTGYNKYIRGDLVNQLKGYTRHKDNCAVNTPWFEKEPQCTCNLFKLLEQIGE